MGVLDQERYLAPLPVQLSESATMNDEVVKREAYWIVEVSQGDKVLFCDKFKYFDSAWNKYQSFKDKDYSGKASVMLQRRFKEYKVA
jgi:hypothetical protein